MTGDIIQFPLCLVLSQVVLVYQRAPHDSVIMWKLRQKEATNHGPVIDQTAIDCVPHRGAREGEGSRWAGEDRSRRKDRRRFLPPCQSDLPCIFPPLPHAKEMGGKRNAAKEQSA